MVPLDNVDIDSELKQSDTDALLSDPDSEADVLYFQADADMDVDSPIPIEPISTSNPGITAQQY